MGSAVQYDLAGGSVELRRGRRDREAWLKVTALPTVLACGDLPHVFGRAHRGPGEGRRRVVGRGVGVDARCGLVEQDGGRGGVAIPSGEGGTLHVALPARAAEPAG